MLDAVADGLRTRLRNETRDVHDALDARVSNLDLTRTRDYAVFLRGQRVGMAALARLQSHGSFVGKSRLEDMVRALDDDLTTQGLTAPSEAPDIAPVQQLALDYIVLGSRLGTAVLKKRWQCSSDVTVLAASAYFSLPSAAADWRAFCESVTLHPARSPIGDAIVADATRLFQLFDGAFAANGA